MSPAVSSNMRKKARITLIVITVLVLTGIGYHLFPYGYFLCYMLSQARAGQRCMDSITEDSIPTWINRTELILEEHDPNSADMFLGLEGQPTVADLKEMRIRRIYVVEDSVWYQWLGGIDHTYLDVQKTKDGGYRFTANYTDDISKVIWPIQ
jgi:hypothetical protein